MTKLNQTEGGKGRGEKKTWMCGCGDIHDRAIKYCLGCDDKRPKKHKFVDSDMFYCTCKICGLDDEHPIHKMKTINKKAECEHNKTEFIHICSKCKQPLGTLKKAVGVSSVFAGTGKNVASSTFPTSYPPPVPQTSSIPELDRNIEILKKEFQKRFGRWDEDSQRWEIGGSFDTAGEPFDLVWAWIIKVYTPIINNSL